MRTEVDQRIRKSSARGWAGRVALVGVVAMMAGAAIAADPPKKSTDDRVAAAPGRVEPKNGEIRIGVSVAIGRVEEVFVSVNDVVEEGELLIRLDDNEARAGLAAAEAKAGAAKRARDDSPVAQGREDAIRTEDALFKSERDVTGARFALDAALAAKRSGTGTDVNLSEARKRLSDARTRLQKERITFATSQAKPNLAAPGPAESGLTAARAEVTMADALLIKSRIRAPSAGTILQINTKAGEIVAPSAEFPLMVMGDMSLLKVKAEVDDGSVSKIKINQKAFVRSINWPGQDFKGRVSAISPSMASPRISGRGPRLPSDVEVLEVTIDLDPLKDDDVVLRPGMRVDAFFK